MAVLGFTYRIAQMLGGEFWNDGGYAGKIGDGITAEISAGWNVAILASQSARVIDA